jgi:hypothetical protein
VQHSEGQANHLQVLAAGGCGDVPRLGAHIVDDRLLEPGNEEVGSLVDDALANTTQTVEDDGAVAALDIVERSLGETETGSERDGEAVDGVECVGHDGVCVVIIGSWYWQAGELYHCRPRRSLRFDDAGVVRARPPPSAFRDQTRKIPHHAFGFESKKDITIYTSTLVASVIYHSPLRLLVPTHNTHKMRPTQMLMGGGGGKPGK